jgi:hypothetical protein
MLSTGLPNMAVMRGRYEIVGYRHVVYKVKLRYDTDGAGRTTNPKITGAAASSAGREPKLPMEIREELNGKNFSRR